MNSATTERLIFISAVAVRAEIDELLPRFEKRHGIAVDVKYDVNPRVAERMMDGESFEVGLTNPWFFKEMIASGRVRSDVHIPFGRVPLSIGAADSAPNRTGTSLDEVRQILSDARSIAYIAAGTSGKTFLKAIELLGLQDAIQDRLRPMGSGEPPVAVANGAAHLAVAPLSRLIAAPGVSPIATFPSELGLDIEMSMFMSKCSSCEAGHQLIRFLADPELDDFLRSRGVHRFNLG